jgi:hypothetical protein
MSYKIIKTHFDCKTIHFFKEVRDKILVLERECCGNPFSY